MKLKTIAISLLSLTFPLSALAVTDQQFAIMQKNMQILAQRYQAQQNVLIAVVQKLKQLEAQQQPVSGATANKTLATKQTVPTQPSQSPASVPSASPQKSSASANPSPEANAASQATSETKQQATGQNLVLQEEHALFGQRLTITPGFSYTQFDRKQLLLSGFLALNAIFLGNIDTSRIKSNTLTFNLGLNYSLNDRNQLSADVPFVYRATKFVQEGANNSSTQQAELNRVSRFRLGDVSVGYGLDLLPESLKYPNIVWNIGLKLPTGLSPYGTPIQTISKQKVDFKVPQVFPTGSGVYSLTNGLSFVRTTDPAIFFANLAYTYNFIQEFSDIDPSPGRQKGQISLGDSITAGLGIAFALNEKTSLSLSFNQDFSGSDKIKFNNSTWATIPDSDSRAATFNTGVTYALSKNFSVVTSLSTGMNGDAPDYAFSVRFPYNFG